MAIKHLTLQTFKEKIFDFDSEQEWSFRGQLPAIIDFYADWCGPCKAVAPVLEELSELYAERLDIYKIDTDKETDLSSLFGIQSIPTFLFIPQAGNQCCNAARFPKMFLLK